MKTLKVLIALMFISGVVLLSIRHHAPAVAAAASAQPVQTVQAPRTPDAADLYQAGLFYQWAERLDTKLQIIHNDEEHQIEIESVKAVPGHYVCAELYETHYQRTLRYVLGPKKTVPTGVDNGAEGDKLWKIMECDSDKAIQMHPKD